MNKKLLIKNTINCHFEIIESVILKYRDILGISDNIPIDIYLHVNDNLSYKKYINDKYPIIKFQSLENYDYFINCTIYQKDLKNIDKEETPNKKYISHEITEKLLENPNVFFLTPLSKKRYLYADVLPYSNSKKHTAGIPIYIIQGNLNQNRRYLDLLIKILNNTYKYKFIIKLIGRGRLPKKLEKYKQKIKLKNNLSFIDYHKEFLNAYCILPLISKKTHPQYYTNKLTSTINYARGYKLKSLLDKDLQKIYNLQDVEVYNGINDISSSFRKTLQQFYKSK